MVTATPILSLAFPPSPQDMEAAASAETSASARKGEVSLMNLLVISYPLAAVTAATRELKEVPLNIEAGLPGQPLLQLAQVAVGEVFHRSAIGANQVVVVL